MNLDVSDELFKIKYKGLLNINTIKIHRYNLTSKIIALFQIKFIIGIRRETCNERKF